jgi:hypothetical protein
MRKRHYYAIIDSFQEGKSGFGYGFANTKTAVAFRTKQARDEYLDATMDLSARACTRQEALRYVEPIRDDRYNYGMGLELRPKGDDGRTEWVYMRY